MKKRGEVDESPWTGQSLPKEQRNPDDKERDFTDAEMKRLLDGTPPRRLGVILRIAALSGARIDAIVSLKVKDCQLQDGEGLFRFKPQKKERAYRHVPIHSDLVELVEGLVKGKDPEDDVFPEYRPVRPGTQQERSMPAVKAFTRYRRLVGVDETRPGRKRALTNFHSFRRWFITKAEQSGHTGRHNRLGGGTQEGGDDLRSLFGGTWNGADEGLCRGGEAALRGDVSRPSGVG